MVSRPSELISMHLIQSFVLSSVLPAALIVGAAYQALMAMNGPDGFSRAEQLAEIRAEAEADLLALQERQASLEARADRLVLASLDDDLLDERVRANLGHMRPGEYRIAVAELDEVASLEVSTSAALTSLIATALLDQGA
ncbi:FtsB family cell division protein [Parvularcula mediterranea]|nr:septum formation initiator family protein [Parvularcula mediterranea]